MAYANKYKATFATKTGKTAYLYLQEDGYSGPLIEYQGISLDYQYLPSSDDPMEVVFASQINVVLDITDDLANMPNFTTMNDRKYFAKLFLDSDLQFFGFALSDSVQLSFNTGRKELSFNAVDGIGLLNNITFPVDIATNINTLETLLYFIYTSLNTLQFPITPNIVTICSIYAQGMQTRADHSYSEPFAQTYLPIRTFLNDVNNYATCWEVLTNILKSFGCRFFIANGKWNIVNINDFASDNFYYTEYDHNGTVVSSGTMNTLSVIQGYTGNTSGLYFIGGGQSKIIRKGYNRITSVVQVKGAVDYLSNGNLRPLSGALPVFWEAGKTTGSTYQVLANPNDASDIFKLYRKNTAGSYVYINSVSYPKVNGGDKLKFTWTYFSQDVTLPRGTALVWIQSGTDYYFWNGTLGWEFSATPPDVTTVGSYLVPAFGDANSVSQRNDVSFETTPAPIAGDVFFSFKLSEGSCQNVQVGAFFMTLTPSLNSITYNATIVDNNQYVNTIEIPFGSYTNAANYPSEYGILLNSTYNALINWYSYGKTTTYTSLLSLITQQYINVFGKNIINIDGSLSSFSTNNGLLNATKVMKADDTDPAQINVSNNYYMLGNSTINYITDETSGTFLQINGNDISATLNYTLTYN